MHPEGAGPSPYPATGTRGGLLNSGPSRVRCHPRAVRASLPPSREMDLGRSMRITAGGGFRTPSRRNAILACLSGNPLIRLRGGTMFARLALLGCIALLAIAATGVVLAATTSVQKEVRITARLLEDGKVEFGLQERTDGGEWSETLLPRVNKFPYATATVDRWLYSSPVALTPVEFEMVEESMVEEPEVEETEIGPFGQWSMDGETQALLGNEIGFGDLSLYCASNGTAWASLTTNRRLYENSDTGLITVQYNVEGGQTQSADWITTERFLSVLGVYSDEASDFARWLSFSATQSPVLYFSATDWRSNTFSAKFDVTGIHAVLEALSCFSLT